MKMESLMRKTILLVIIIVSIALGSCGKSEPAPKQDINAAKNVHPVMYEAFANGKRIGYATFSYLEDSLSDIRFFDANEKLLLIMMPEYNEAITKVNWTLLSRSFTAAYEYVGEHPLKVRFSGDSDFAIVRFLEEGIEPSKRVVVVTAGKRMSYDGSPSLQTVDIEYEYIATHRRTAAAIFKVDNYDDPAGYLIYHYDDHGNLAMLDYKNPLMKKQDSYQVKLKYSGVGKADPDITELLEQIFFLPAPVIFEWILD